MRAEGRARLINYTFTVGNTLKKPLKYCFLLHVADHSREHNTKATIFLKT